MIRFTVSLICAQHRKALELELGTRETSDANWQQIIDFFQNNNNADINKFDSSNEDDKVT